MDVKTELDAWILDLVSRLSPNIQIEHLTWGRELIPQMTNIAIHMKYRDRELTGWGCGTDERTALHKAVAEVVERATMIFNGLKTSNGLAAHVTREEANLAAAQELRERDSFLCHFHTRTPFRPLDQSFLEKTGFDKISRWFSAHGAFLKPYQMDCSGAVVIIDGRTSQIPFGFIIGAARKENILLSVAAAANEVCRVGHRLLSEANFDPISLADFMKLPKVGFRDHGRLALDLNYASRISGLFESGIINAEINDISGIQLWDLETDQEIFPECPLKFSLATSPNAQDLYVGEPTWKDINIERLSQFKNTGLKKNGIFMLPHPFS